VVGILRARATRFTWRAIESFTERENDSGEVLDQEIKSSRSASRKS
jgi:hypothetical protein